MKQFEMKKRISVSVETNTLQSLFKAHRKDLYRIVGDYIVSLHEMPKDGIILNSTPQTRKNTSPINLATYLQLCFMDLSAICSNLDKETKKDPVKLISLNKQEISSQLRQMRLAIIEAERLMQELDKWEEKDKPKIKAWIEKERKKLRGKPPESESQF